MPAAPNRVDQYLAEVSSPTARSALQNLRKIILEEVPDAEEVISYGIPSYKFGEFFVSFAAFKSHCSFFPGHTVADFTEELKNYKTSKGTVQFTPEKPLPDALVREMIRARLKESLEGK